MIYFGYFSFSIIHLELKRQIRLYALAVPLKTIPRDLRQKWPKSIPVYGSKTIPFGAAHTYREECPPPPPLPLPGDNAILVCYTCIQERRRALIVICNFYNFVYDWQSRDDNFLCRKRLTILSKLYSFLNSWTCYDESNSRSWNASAVNGGLNCTFTRQKCGSDSNVDFCRPR